MDNLVFLIRQSPDWASLAGDYEAGKDIDIRRYKPGHEIPGFPRRIERLIETWNRLFALNFFRCRQILKEIALGSVLANPGARLVAEKEFPEQADEIRRTNALLFYMDDDDLFAPDLQQRVAGIDMTGIDIAVFPLVRFGITTYTFVRANAAAGIVIGARRDFDFRFQTNNYAIRTERVGALHISHLKDHVEASAYADRHALQDRYFDRIVSATNKTPCSASGLPELLRQPHRTGPIIRRYTEALKAQDIPASEPWLCETIGQTIGLFEQLLASARADAHFGITERLRLRFA